MASTSKGRKGKLGKNKHRIAVYYNSGRHFFNAARKIVHHIRRYSNSDNRAVAALKNCLAAMPLTMEREFKKLYTVEKLLS